MTIKIAESVDPQRLGPAIDLATAAALLGIGRSASYELVRKDRFPVPVLRIGRSIRIPTAPLLTLLGLSGNAARMEHDEHRSRRMGTTVAGWADTSQALNS